MKRRGGEGGGGLFVKLFPDATKLGNTRGLDASGLIGAAAPIVAFPIIA